LIRSTLYLSEKIGWWVTPFTVIHVLVVIAVFHTL
jgi:hypothetical protein